MHAYHRLDRVAAARKRIFPYLPARRQIQWRPLDSRRSVHVPCRCKVVPMRPSRRQITDTSLCLYSVCTFSFPLFVRPRWRARHGDEEHSTAACVRSDVRGGCLARPSFHAPGNALEQQRARPVRFRTYRTCTHRRGTHQEREQSRRARLGTTTESRFPGCIYVPLRQHYVTRDLCLAPVSESVLLLIRSAFVSTPRALWTLVSMSTGFDALTWTAAGDSRFDMEPNANRGLDLRFDDLTYKVNAWTDVFEIGKTRFGAVNSFTFF